MTSVVSGIAYKITGGYTIGALPQSMMVLGQGYFIGVPLQVWVMAVIFVLGWYVLNKTPFGRYNYAIGGNTEAARLSGINVDFIKISVFMIISALAGISGIILTSRLMAGSPDIGSGWEMNVIAATIIGGTSLFGGEGKITGTLVGVLFIGVLDNAMVLWNLSPYTQMIVSGSVILAAVVLSNLKNRKSFS
jgi:ribose transport system permease protein